MTKGKECEFCCKAWEIGCDYDWEHCAFYEDEVKRIAERKKEIEKAIKEWRS